MFNGNNQSAEHSVDANIPVGESSKPGIGQRLSLLAKLKGLTQEEIAKHCSISRISVNRFFRQRTEIRAKDFKTLLETLGIDLEHIIDKAIELQLHGPKKMDATILLPQNPLQKAAMNSSIPGLKVLP